MTVPPWSPEAEDSRPHFRRLRELKAKCEQVLGAPLPHLSMGMSGDFEIAIEEGDNRARRHRVVWAAREGQTARGRKLIFAAIFAG